MNFFKNEITAVEGNTISFTVEHYTGNERYALQSNEKYKVKISKSLNDATEDVIEATSNNSNFSVSSNGLAPGEYYFQISIVDELYGRDEVISPAVDKRGERLNTLVIVERL